MSSKNTYYNFKRSGFTLVEMLVVLAIILLIAAMGLRFYDQFRVAARDKERQFIVQTLSQEIEQYKNNFGHYPIAGGRAPQPFTYTDPSCSGSAWTGWAGNTGANGYGIRFDNSSSGMILEMFRAGYQGRLFTDPLNEWGTGSDRYTCRYVIPMTSKDETENPLPTNLDGSNPCSRYPRCCPGGTCVDLPVPCSSYACEAADVQIDERWPHPDTYLQVQSYGLHCTLESPSEISVDDNGSPTAAGADLIEYYVPNRWYCISDISS